METQQTTEEGVKLAVPSGSGEDPFHKLAFYNPRMAFNRSISSLALSACNALDEKFGEIVLLDGLCATGARGIRYALENSFVKKVFFVDGNEHAVELLKKNLELNGLQKRGVWVHSEFNEFLENFGEAFDFVEIDPFGTPAPFLKNSLGKIAFGKRGYGILSVTATDLAALSGKEPAVCEKNYQAKPMRCSFTHEMALRILVGKVAREAQALGLDAEPAFSFYQGHSVKTICKIGGKRNPAKNENFGFVSFCRKCLTRKWGNAKVEKCPSCGGKMDWAGPLWLAETSHKKFVEKMLKILRKKNYSEKKRIEKMLLSLKEEIDLPPFFYDLHEMAGKLSTFAPKTADVIEKLEKGGFEASLTHYSPVGIRTDASNTQVKKSLIEAQKRQ